MKNKSEVLLILAILIFLNGCKTGHSPEISMPAGSGYIEISSENPDYFQYSDGTPYIPVGINMVSPGGRHQDPDSGLMEIGLWMKKLSENDGNYIRIWLSQSFWDIEDQKAGEYSEGKAQRIDQLIKMAAEYRLRVKMTLEHFRSLTLEENPQSWAVKSVYHISNGGPLKNNRDYLSSPEGNRLFLDKIDFYRNRFGSSDTLFFGWELWNEMNAMRGPQDSLFFSWNEKMLAEVKKRFPKNLVMQSLGSFDTERVDSLYKAMMLLPGNEVAQVHRYLDLGAELEVCHMPMDIICSSAVERLRSYKTGKPVILAETGAVEPGHSGPSRFYAADTSGMLLHDILFAPFFSGAAGAGMSWHWDSYVDKNNLWYHYKRFSQAVKGINPIKEKFAVSKSETENFRIYILNGTKTILIWLRDKNNTWESELRDGRPPVSISGAMIDTEQAGIVGPLGEIKVYDPWKDKWEGSKVKNGKVLLPEFKRSLVIRIQKK